MTGPQGCKIRAPLCTTKLIKMTNKGRILFQATSESDFSVPQGSALVVTGFTQADLVSFGNYLLSEHRKQLVLSHPERTAEENTESLSYVSHADLQNWLETSPEYTSSISILGGSPA